MAEKLPRAFGRYELVAELARGGMAQLYLGKLIGIAGFAKPLAIKRILPHLSEDKRFVEMFLNEGRIAAKLAHPNICSVFELGEVDGELFLAMEYLEGVQWGDLVEAAVAAGSMRDPVAVLRIAASTIAQACDGLHYAHELHDSHGEPMPVIHRDISPGNLFVTVDGTCKVLDFGVSKIATEKDETRSGLIKGKLAYMPPEQLKGEAIDARVDVFAMTVVLWEALAGQRLFMRDNDYLIYKAVLEEPIPTIGHLFPPAIGPRIDAMLMRGLARDRDQRYSTIRELADELRSIVVPLGGVPSPHEIGRLVRDTFELQLAARSQLVAQLSTVYESSAAETLVDAEALDEGPSVTRSVIVRDASLAVERAPQRRRWPLVAIPLVAVVAVAALALAWPSKDTPPAAASEDTVVAMTGEPGEPAAGSDSVGGDAGAAEAALADAAEMAEVAVEDIEITPPEPTPTEPAPRDPAPRDPAPRDTGRTGRRTNPPPPPPPPPPTDTRPGFYSVDSRPYATIFIDGKRVDETPLYRVELPPGRHQVKAVLASGQTKSFTIKIEPGNEVTSGTLRW